MPERQPGRMMDLMDPPQRLPVRLAGAVSDALDVANLFWRAIGRDDDAGAMTLLSETWPQASLGPLFCERYRGERDIRAGEWLGLALWSTIEIVAVDRVRFRYTLERPEGLVAWRLELVHEGIYWRVAVSTHLEPIGEATISTLRVVPPPDPSPN